MILHETQVGELTVRVLRASAYSIMCPVVASLPGEDRWAWWMGLQSDGPDPTVLTSDGELIDEVISDCVCEEVVRKMIAAFGVPWKVLPGVVDRQAHIVIRMPAVVRAELADESPEELRALRRVTGDDLDAMPLALRAIRLQKTDRWGAIS